MLGAQSDVVVFALAIRTAGLRPAPLQFHSLLRFSSTGNPACAASRYAAEIANACRRNPTSFFAHLQFLQ
jgi:hypothetical protein